MGPVDPFVPLTCTPIQAPDCKPPPPPEQCDIEWWYCPRDPDCDGYDMSVEQIVVSTDIGSRTPEFFAPGDSVNVHVNGTTTLTSVDPGATYRIYQLAGGNQATGVLADVIQINGDRFDINLPFGLVDGNFVTNLNWFEFGIDIFREPEATSTRRPSPLSSTRPSACCTRSSSSSRGCSGERWGCGGKHTTWGTAHQPLPITVALETSIDQTPQPTRMPRRTDCDGTVNLNILCTTHTVD